MAATSSTWTDKSHGRKRECRRRTHRCHEGGTNKDKKEGRGQRISVDGKRVEGDEKDDHTVQKETNAGRGD